MRDVIDLGGSSSWLRFDQAVTSGTLGKSLGETPRCSGTSRASTQVRLALGMGPSSVLNCPHMVAHLVRNTCNLQQEVPGARKSSWVGRWGLALRCHLFTYWAVVCPWLALSLSHVPRRRHKHQVEQCSACLAVRRVRS